MWGKWWTGVRLLDRSTDAARRLTPHLRSGCSLITDITWLLLPWLLLPWLLLPWLKLDGFRGLADTIQGRMLSKNGNRLKRFGPLLDTLPPGYVFDGEIVALDGDGRPRFSDLLFGRREPAYIPFDVLVVDGEDMRALALKERKALLDRLCGDTGWRRRSRSLARAGRCSGPFAD